ncbi:MAG: hypothetical protein U5K81_05175 [Trueperaceae bacterium]|nr:hypothetical protein [Trueperaceae bacterium]
MSFEAWSRLAEPFGPDGVAWDAVAEAADGARVRLAPRPSAAALRARLDEVVGPEAWSLRLRPWGADGLIAELAIGGATRAAARKAPPGRRTHAGAAAPEAGWDADRLAASAFAAAAGAFGIETGIRLQDDGWVDADPDTGEPLYLPEHRGAAPAPPADPPSGGTDGAAPADDKPEGHAMIDRLVERLRGEGLGAEAARIVTLHGGYGRDAEERRALYAELRAVLVQGGPRA